MVVIDECHRSIYNLWRQVIEYFDSFHRIVANIEELFSELDKAVESLMLT